MVVLNLQNTKEKKKLYINAILNVQRKMTSDKIIKFEIRRLKNFKKFTFCKLHTQCCHIVCEVVCHIFILFLNYQNAFLICKQFKFVFKLILIINQL